MQVYTDPHASGPFIEGDRVECIRAMLSQCSAPELALLRAEFRRPNSFAQDARIAQLQAAREDRGLAPLKLFAPEPDPMPDVVVWTPELEREAILQGAAGPDDVPFELTEWVADDEGVFPADEPIPFALAPDDLE